MDIKTIIIVVFTLITIQQWSKSIIFKSTTRGLLYYIEMHYGESLKTEKVKELQRLAFEQMLKEFLHKS